MLKYLSLLLISGCSIQNAQVVNKYEATDPSVAVVSDSGNGFCGGVWVDKNLIFTANHCVSDITHVSNGRFKIKGKVIETDEFTDLAVIKTEVDNNYWAKIGEPKLNEKLTVIMPPGKKITVNVVKIDNLWNGVQVDWLAPNGASGSPAYNDKGEVVCIITKRIPNVGGFCNTITKFQNIK
jgi:S1-C subfamily serine protease